jgi:hypothetical protein
LWYQKWYLCVTGREFEGAYAIKNSILYSVGTCDSSFGEVKVPLLVPQVCSMESQQQ